MSEHEEWHSRMQRGEFVPAEWARDVKRDIAAYRVADAAVRREVEINEGDDPMSDEYKRLDTIRSHAASNVHRHLSHEVLLAITTLVEQSDQIDVDWSVVREAVIDTCDANGIGGSKSLARSFNQAGLLVIHRNQD